MRRSSASKELLAWVVRAAPPLTPHVLMPLVKSGAAPQQIHACIMPSRLSGPADLQLVRSKTAVLLRRLVPVVIAMF